MATADWERIEADYRAGVLSIREIASQHGISHPAISKKAKALGWSRDLSEKIKAKADELVTKAEVTTAVTTPKAVTERDIVEANAASVAHVAISQRKDIKRFRSLAMSLLEELETQTVDSALLTQLADLLNSDEEDAQSRRMQLFNAVISSPGRIDSLKKLGDTLKTLITLERQAYNMDTESEKDPDKIVTGIVRRIIDAKE